MQKRGEERGWGCAVIIVRRGELRDVG
jgi:hypothetical protein